MSLALLLGPQLRAFADGRATRSSAPRRPGPHVDGARSAGASAHVPLRHATRSMAPRRGRRALRRAARALPPAARRTSCTRTTRSRGSTAASRPRAARVPAIVNTVHGLYALPEDPLGQAGARLLARAHRGRVLGRRAGPERRGRRRRCAARASRERSSTSSATASTSRASTRRASTAPRGLRPGGARGGPGRHRVRCRRTSRLGEGLPRGLRRGRAAPRRGSAPSRVVVIGPSRRGEGRRAHARPTSRGRAATGVAFLGMRDDVDDLYAAMDLYVLASYREGFPRSAMEAAAMGVPVVVTDIRGCRQVVDDGRTGRLVPVRDAAALANADRRTCCRPRAAHAMSRAATEKADREFDQRHASSK